MHSKKHIISLPLMPSLFKSFKIPRCGRYFLDLAIDKFQACTLCKKSTQNLSLAAAARTR